MTDRNALRRPRRRHRGRLMLLAVATTAVLSLPAAAQPAPAHAAFLDSHEALADGAAGPRTVSPPLRRGRRYVVTVEGTFSFYAAASWASSCGRTEARPRFASPGQPLGPVGFDAERILALPTSEASCSGPAFPRRWRNFQLDAGGGFRHPRAVAGRPDAHTHRYRVRGSGRALRARLLDEYAPDNYGRLRITVRPLGGDRRMSRAPRFTPLAVWRLRATALSRPLDVRASSPDRPRHR